MAGELSVFYRTRIHAGNQVTAGDTFSGPPTLTFEPGAAREGAGSDQLSFTVTDAGDGVDGQMTSDSATVAIDIVQAVADGDVTIDGDGIVRVGGTTGNDRILISRSLFSSKLRVWINGQLVSQDIPLSNVSEVRVWGRDGNDRLSALASGANTMMHGGAGDDRIIGDFNSDLLFGGSGNDRLYGNFGDDMLVGGAGSDLLVGSLGDDILIGGDVSETFTDEALRLALEQWADQQLQDPVFADGLLEDEAFDLFFDSVGDNWFGAS